MKTTITLVVDHDKPIAALPELVAGRAWTIDGVKTADVIIIEQAPERARTTDAQAVLATQPDEISPRWTDVV